MFVVKTNCPYCGAEVEVDLSYQEEVKFLRKKSVLPADFDKRAVCQCCIDDGCCLDAEQPNVWDCRMHY